MIIGSFVVIYTTIFLSNLGNVKDIFQWKNNGDLRESKYSSLIEFLKDNPNHPVLEPMPFNSGYFMCFNCKGITAETIRRDLLKNHGIGVIALGESCLRVAFSSIDEEKIIDTYRTIYDAARKLSGE